MSSCQTFNQIRIKTLDAPVIIINPNIKRIALLNRNAISKKDTVSNYYSINTIIVKDSINHDSVFNKNLYLGFSSNLSDLLASDSIVYINGKVDSSYYNIEDVPYLKWENVDKICLDNNVDFLVSKESSMNYMQYEIETVEGGYIADMSIKHFILWRFYDQKLREKSEYLKIDSLFVSGFSSNYDKLISKELPSRSQINSDIGYISGEDCAKTISPSIRDVIRKYYITGDKRMKAANYFVSQSNWDTAIELWLSILEENKSKESNRACYNLALAYEYKGDIDMAISYIRKSIYFAKQDSKLIKELKSAQFYTLILQERKINDKKLKLFFGEE